MLKKICSGCGRITEGKGYCPECEKKFTARRWQTYQSRRKASQDNFYQSKAWKVLRMTVMERDCWLCQECLRRGIYNSATDVDHIIPRSQGGSDELDNLQALCHECHKSKTSGDNKQNQKG